MSFGGILCVLLLAFFLLLHLRHVVRSFLDPAILISLRRELPISIVAKKASLPIDFSR